MVKLLIQGGTVENIVKTVGKFQIKYLKMDQPGIDNLEERKKTEDKDCHQGKHCGCWRKQVGTESLKCKYCEFGTNIWFM